MNRKKAKQLRIMLAVMAVTGGCVFQDHAWAAEFNGKPGTYTDFVDYDGEIITPTGKSDYTFAKGARLNNPKGKEAFQVDDPGQDVTIHVGKADGHTYDFEANGYNLSFRNINEGSPVSRLTIDDTIDGKSTGADYHFTNNEKSREDEESGSVKTLFFYGNSETAIKGHSVTIDSARYRDTTITPKKNSHGILSSNAKSVQFDLSGDFNLDNEQRGIYMTADTHDSSMDIQAKNIQITCKDPNENLSYARGGTLVGTRVGVSAYGDPYTSTLQMKSTDDIHISGYSLALQGLGYVDMKLEGKNITLDGNPSDGKSLQGVDLYGASPEESKIALKAQNSLDIIGGTGENGYGVKNTAGAVTGSAENISVSGSVDALYSILGGTIQMTANHAEYQGNLMSYSDSAIQLNADTNIIKGNVTALDGSTVTFDGKQEDGSGTVTILNAGGTGVLAGIYNTAEEHALSEVTVKQNAVVNVHDDSNDHSYQDKEFTDVGSSALMAQTNSKITVDKAQGIYGNITADIGTTAAPAADAKTGGTVDVTTAAGGEIKGNISAGHGGTANITLAKGDWEGRATDYQGTDAAGTTNLTMQDGAAWHMRGDSYLTSLNNASSLVDMKAHDAYQTLHIGTFTGKNGTFLMKTDLDSQTDGDKIQIADAAAGSQGSVQVYDKSFLTGSEVTGVKNLLLITDESKNAVFTGESLDKGGLWDVTPTIQRGDTVKDAQGNTVGDATQWYLTKIQKSINKDTKPLLGAADYAYGSYRMDIETLRQRMGELRFLKDKKDESGIWARMYGGEFDGPGYDSRYHALQLGYDYAADPKSFYGFFGERGIASPHYDYGTSSNHSLAAGVYGTWFGDSGVYTDAVAKWGRDDVDLHTFGSYLDQANYRTRAASLSLEYGKTMKLNDKGLFLEPQAQLVYGHLGSTHYTTVREKQVHMDDYDSFIGRVGFVFGRRTPDAEKPLDYYLRLSALHEFGGRRGMHLSAADGETMDWSRDYDSTWYEASLGGTYRLNDRTTLYGDVQRSFGSDWHKKWQGNIGINWQF